MKPLHSGEGMQGPVLLNMETILFVFSIVIGYVLFSDTLGWGDSLNLLSRSLSMPDFVHRWWIEWNGRMSQAAIFAFLLMPLRWLSDTPEQFPWWLVRSVALFCLLSAPILMLASLPHTIRPQRWHYLVVLILILWIVWSLNPVTYETSAWFTVAEFVGYSLPIFLISVSILVLSRSLVPSISKNPALSSGFVMLGAFVFSMMGEQQLLVFPIFAIGIALSGVARGEIRMHSVTRVGLLCVISVVVGMLIYWLAPAQQGRNTGLGLHIGNLWEVYEKSVYFGYEFLSQQFVYSNISSMALKIFLLIIHTVFLFVATKWAWQDFKRKPSFPSPLRGSGVLLLTMLVAYQACFVTLIVSNYFPVYAYELPALLLAIAYITAALILLRKTKLRSSRNQWAWPAWYVAGFAVTGAVLYLGYGDYIQNRDTNEQKSGNDSMRRLVYERVWQEASHTDQKEFALVNCPSATSKFGWSMEAPWGLSAYFNWRGMPLEVFLRGNYDFPKNWKDGSYKIIDCDEFVPSQQQAQENSLSDSGHIVSDRSWMVATEPAQGWNSEQTVKDQAWKRSSVVGQYGMTFLKLGGLPESTALWIRHNPVQDDTRDTYYRKTVSLAESVSGKLRISGINRYELFINGRLIGTGNLWTTLGEYHVRLKDGDVIAVHTNSDTPGDDALLVDFQKDSDGGLLTNNSWSVSTVASEGWNQKAFQEGNTWLFASTVGEYGNVFLRLAGLPESAAYWIRHSSVDQNKTIDTYYRKTVSLAESVSGKLRISGINRYELFINGRLIGTGNLWTTLGEYHVRLQDGDVIAVHTDTDEPGDDALLVDFQVIQ